MQEQVLFQNANEGVKGFGLPLTFFSEEADEKKASQSAYGNEYEILTTSKISSKIIEIIDESREYCLIVTPYLKLWHHLENSLKTTSDKNKRIIFFFRNDKDNKAEIKKFYDKYKFDIVFINNLHAKIYLNEKEALITSMNLYDASQKDNYEIGILLKEKTIIDNHVKTYIIDQIFNTGKIDELALRSDNNYYKLLESNLFFEKNISYCVTCGNPRKYKKDFIHCEKCKILSEKENVNIGFDTYKYCYLCGKEYNRSGLGNYSNKNKALNCPECTIKIKNL